MNIKFNKSKINLIIDAVMLIVIMLVVGLGLLIKYVLVAGFKCHENYGKGVKLSYWGYDRHYWGTIHLIFGLILILLLTIHIILHWKMITKIFKQMVRNRSQRRIISVTLAVGCIVLAIGPLFVSPNVSESIGRNKHVYAMKDQEALQKNSIESISKKTKDSFNIRKYKHNKSADIGESEIDVFGYMTIHEISTKYDISCDYLKTQIGVPASTTNNSRMGQLKKKYNFSMGDVKRVIKNERVETR